MATNNSKQLSSYFTFFTLSKCEHIIKQSIFLNYNAPSINI